jgi:hypothetical protein
VTLATGGTIAAGVTTYYMLVPIGRLAQVGNNTYIKSVTTGSATATNSNVISFNAAGGLGYYVYSSSSDSPLTMLSIGQVGPGATAFIDTGITGSAPPLGVCGGGITQIVGFSTVTEDTMQAYNPATFQYTVPVSGRWLKVIRTAAWSASTGALLQTSMEPPGYSSNINPFYIGFGSGFANYDQSYDRTSIKTHSAGDILELQCTGRYAEGFFSAVDVYLIYLGR